jgi:hypothetical protein
MKITVDFQNQRKISGSNRKLFNFQTGWSIRKTQVTEKFVNRVTHKWKFSTDHQQYQYNIY